MRAARRALTGRPAAFLADRGGNLATMTAMLAPAALALAAIAIDFGALYTQRRELQSLADLSAIRAAAHLDRADAAVLTTLSDNGRPSARIVTQAAQAPLPGRVDARVQPGRYSGSADIAPADRFVAGATPSNAVRVTLYEAGERYFGSSLFAAPTVSTRGVARVSALAAFSVGSRLASLDGGVANALLSGLVGGNVSLQLMDYQALVKADVEIFTFLDILATKAGLTGVTYSDLLASQVSVGTIAAALAEVPGLDNRSKAALRALGLAANGNLKLPLGKLLDLGEAAYLALGERPAGLSAAANALQVLTAAAALANGTNQIALNLGGTIPGVLSATLDLAIGEAAQMSSWLKLGETGTVVRTAQTRLLLTVQLPGPGGILGDVVSLPIYIELANAEGTLARIACPDGSSGMKVTISAKPGAAELRIAAIDKSAFARFDRSPVAGAAKLVDLVAVTVQGSAFAEITSTSATKLDFTRADIEAGTVKTVSTRDPAKTLTASLLDKLTLTVKLAGLDLGLSGILKTTLSGTLTAAAPAIDQLLMAVLDTLGISVGEADIRVHGASCGRSVLVQ